MKVGDLALIVESNRSIRRVVIKKISGNTVLVQFTNNGGGIRVNKSRIFLTREEAENEVRKHNKNQKSEIIYQD
jgi:hypothetical protein